MYGTPVADKIRTLLLEDRVDLARGVLKKSREEDLFTVDGCVNIYDMVACIECFQLHEMGGLT